MYDDSKKDQVVNLKRIRIANGGCRHMRIMIDEQMEFAECGDCHEKLNPMWVLKRYSENESRLSMDIKENKRLLKALEKKIRTKCKHCGKFTDVNIK